MTKASKQFLADNIAAFWRPAQPWRAGEVQRLAANLEARMYELETLRTWDRNPQVYADAIGTRWSSRNAWQ